MEGIGMGWLGKCDAFKYTSPAWSEPRRVRCVQRGPVATRERKHAAAGTLPRSICVGFRVHDYVCIARKNRQKHVFRSVFRSATNRVITDACRVKDG
jgi:hypothetical protein